VNDIAVGIDIGTSNVRAVIGEYGEDGSLLITGIGSAVSTGLRAGLIVNIESTMKSIKTAVENAEMMAGREVDSCITAIGGGQIESLISKGLLAITTKPRGSREINGADIERVIEASRAINIPLDRHILHVIPRSYIVDGQSGIKDPMNMLGVRLEAEVCIITSSGTSTQNLLRCISRAGYTVNAVMLKTLSSAQAVVTDEEKELGSIVLDLGGGTTDVLVLAEGSPLCAVSVPVGGSLVTNDISLVRGISYDTAEKIKKTSGCCWEPLIGADEEVVIPGIGGNPPQVVSRREICAIIQPRIEEIFAMVRQKLPEQVKKQCSFSLGTEYVDTIKPSFDPLVIRREHAYMKEGLAMCVHEDRLPMAQIKDLRDILLNAKKGRTLTAQELIDEIIIPNIGKNNPNFINELLSLILMLSRP